MSQYDARLSKLESKLSANENGYITLEELVADEPIDRHIPDGVETLRCGERGTAFPLAWFDQFGNA